MEEKIMYFIWKFNLYKADELINSNNQKIEIISPGIQNFDAGPDFFNAKIKINQTLWVGNVEMHLKASDWDKHLHQHDKAYNNVILHIVLNDDKTVYNQNKDRVPTLQLELNNEILQKYKEFNANDGNIPCKKDINIVDNFKLGLWLNNVAFERISQKTEAIKNKLVTNKNNWEESFYQSLARNFGFNLNADPFERLARSLPLKYLAKHQNNLLQIEALLYGQAGFLADNINNEYFHELQTEYTHLKNKFNLQAIEKHSWKFLRSRPSNFPLIRISQFANLINSTKSLFSKIININNPFEIRELFNLKASEYWLTHYTFEKSSAKKEKRFGINSVNNIIINTIVPYIFLYGEITDDQKPKDKAINLLENTKAENNYITREWNEQGMKITNALLSQAVIQQTKNYCQKGKCLDCGIGSEILKNIYNNN